MPQPRHFGPTLPRWLARRVLSGFSGGQGHLGNLGDRGLRHGGFHIWPKGERDNEMMTAAAEVAAPAEAIGQDLEVGAPAIPAQRSPA